MPPQDRVKFIGADTGGTPRPSGYFEGLMSIADAVGQSFEEKARKLKEYVEKSDYGQILGDVVDAITPENPIHEMIQRSGRAAQNVSQGKPLVDPQQNMREANDQLLSSLSVPPEKFHEAVTAGDYPYIAGQATTSALLNSALLSDLGGGWGGKTTPKLKGLPEVGTGIDDLEFYDPHRAGRLSEPPPAPSPVEELRAQNTGLSKIGAVTPELVEGGAPALPTRPSLPPPSPTMQAIIAQAPPNHPISDEALDKLIEEHNPPAANASIIGQAPSTITPGTPTGRVAQFGPYRDELQAQANRDNVIASGVRPERGVPVVHDPQFGGFQQHTRGGESWITHPMFKDPIGPFPNDMAAFDWTLEAQETPTFRSQLDPGAPNYLPPSNVPDWQLQQLLQGVPKYQGLGELPDPTPGDPRVFGPSDVQSKVTDYFAPGGQFEQEAVPQINPADIYPELDPRMAQRAVEGDRIGRTFAESPTFGQQQLPLVGESPIRNPPVGLMGEPSGDIQQIRAREVLNDRLRQPEQLSMAGDLGDSIVSQYLGGEDATPPEMRDLSDYGPDKLEPPRDEPSFARIPGKGYTASMNVSRGIENITRDYSGPLSGIMVREAMQNALDAVQSMGAKGEVRVRINREDSAGANNGAATIEIHDNGPGLDDYGLAKKLFEVFSTGKIDDPNATGGKGIGSASFIYGGAHFEIESTAVAPDGKKYTITASGTPQQFADQTVGSDRTERQVPMSTPTGTRIKITLKKGDPKQSQDSANTMLEDVLENTRDRPTKVIFDRYGYNTPGQSVHEILENPDPDNDPYGPFGEGHTFKSSKDDKTVADFTLLDNEIKVQVPKYDENVKVGMTKVHFLNNGMYQFTKAYYPTEAAKGVPPRAIVNIHPLVDETHDNYPFINTREHLKEHLAADIDKVIEKKLTGPAVERKKNRTQELYDQMPHINVPGTKRKTVLFDPGMRFTPEETADLVSDPTIHKLAKHFDFLVDDILKKVGRSKWSDRLEGVGLVFDDNLNGVHIPNPTTKKSTILFSVFPRIGMHTPEDAAYQATTTVKHEIAHIGEEAGAGLMPNFTPADENDPRYPAWIKTFFDQSHTHGDVSYRNTGHGLGFFHRLAEVYSKTGVGGTYDAAKQLERIYTGGSSTSYSPEIQGLLRLHQERAGRPEVTEDLLSGTGVKQSNRGSLRKGTISSNDKANGVGIFDEQMSKRLDEIFKRLTSR